MAAYPHLRSAPALAALCVAVLAVSAASCKKTEAVQAPAPALAVSTVPVAKRDLARSETVSGPVSAVEEMLLGVEVSGLRVTALRVDVGQPVKRGQVLLTLDQRILDSDLAQANAALREAEAGLQLTRTNLARGENLVAQRFISAGAMDELRAANTQAEARVGTARAARDAAALRRSFAELRAPDDGIISRRLVQSGQVVGAGQELLRLIRNGRLEWRAELSSEQLRKVRVGDRIELRTDDGRVVQGDLRAVSPGVDPAMRTGTVFADLPDPAGLQPGMFLQGRIETGAAQVAAAPVSAVVLRDGYTTVFTVDDQNIAHQVQVETGLRDGGFVEIRKGLQPGASVVIEGSGFLAEGDRVRIVPASTAQQQAAVASAAP